MLHGIYTALITPFTAQGQLDMAGLEALTEFQLTQGVSGLVPIGTTGESPTLLDTERGQILAQIDRQTNGRTTIIAGAGSHSTAHALEHCRRAAEHGVDGVLLVDPYYNGPSSLEIRREYIAPIAREMPPHLELIPYLVPARTGTRLEAQDLALLAREFANICTVKEASTPDHAADIRRLCGAQFSILCGEDRLNLALMQRGDIAANGAISVVANIAPAALQAMYTYAHAGQWREAEQIQRRLAPLCSIVQVETVEQSPCGPVPCRARNPVPIKTLMHLLGMPAGPCRAPLGRLARGGLAQVRRAIQQVLDDDASILEPIEHFFNVDIAARLADPTLEETLAYSAYVNTYEERVA